MRRTWIFFCLATCCTIIIIFFSFYYPAPGRIFLARDPFDPLAAVLETYTDESINQVSPYQLGHEIAGLNGMAFVYGSQARSYANESTVSDYKPLFSASIVIAVNQNGNSAGKIDGWYSLLQSEAVVLIPDNGTESGRLAAIALSRGVGAVEGDLMPALQAFSQLEMQGRLNPGNEYADSNYRNVYQPHRPANFDAVIMWDYQARSLVRTSDHWDIINPVEGTVIIDCGYVLGGSASTREKLLGMQDFLSSTEGQNALINAGFSPLQKITDVTAWDESRLLYNPRFRRMVRAVKLYAPASVRERMLLKSITLLLFCIAAQKVIRRVPPGLRRSTNSLALLFVLVWMIPGILKAISLHPDPVRYFWFATYIARHGLPLLWYCMCHVQVYNRLPTRKRLGLLTAIAILLTLLVMTNDLHRQVFRYHLQDPRTWEHQYSNGWGYYLSFLWSFSISFYGLLILFREKITRQQKRQYIYAGIFFLSLIAYQIMYIIGIIRIIDLDIPTTVAIFVMVFILAAQRQRFMGALLLALPTFKSTPHAISVYDRQGNEIYRNQVMEEIEEKLCINLEIEKETAIYCENKIFEPHIFPLEKGKALILKDITDLKILERSLEISHKKLNAIHKLLLHRSEETPVVISRIEQERYSRQIDLLLKEKLEAARSLLGKISDKSLKQDCENLRKARFIIYICQHRLRIIIAGMETYPEIPAEIVTKYGTGVIKSGLSIGLDGVFSAVADGDLSCVSLPDLLDVIDSICFLALDIPESSLVLRLETNISGIAISASISNDKDLETEKIGVPLEILLQKLSGMGGQTEHAVEEDGITIRIQLVGREVMK